MKKFRNLLYNNFSVDQQESLHYMRSHCCGVVLNGKFHLLGGQTKRSNDMSADVESNMHQVYIPSGKQGAWEFSKRSDFFVFLNSKLISWSHSSWRKHLTLKLAFRWTKSVSLSSATFIWVESGLVVVRTSSFHLQIAVNHGSLVKVPGKLKSQCAKCDSWALQWSALLVSLHLAVMSIWRIRNRSSFCLWWPKTGPMDRNPVF